MGKNPGSLRKKMTSRAFATRAKKSNEKILLQQKSWKLTKIREKVTLRLNDQMGQGKKGLLKSCFAS